MSSARKTQVFITVSAIVIAIVHLVWPDLSIDGITLALFVVAVLPWLAPLLKSLELPGGWKVEFQELQKIKNDAAKAGLLEASAIKGVAEEAYSFKQILDQDPNLALAGLRIEVEKRLRKIAEVNGIEMKRPSVYQLLRILTKEQLLSPEESSVLADMNNLLNSAVHGAKIDQRTAEWAIEIGAELLSSLDKKTVNKL